MQNSLWFTRRTRSTHKLPPCAVKKRASLLPQYVVTDGHTRIKVNPRNGPAHPDEDAYFGYVQSEVLRECEEQCKTTGLGSPVRDHILANSISVSHIHTYSHARNSHAEPPTTLPVAATAANLCLHVLYMHTRVYPCLTVCLQILQEILSDPKTAWFLFTNKNATATGSRISHHWMRNKACAEGM